MVNCTIVTTCNYSNILKKPKALYIGLDLLSANIQEKPKGGK